MEIIKLFFDVETTGLNTQECAITQLSGMVERNDEVVEEFNFRMAPHAGAEINQEALEVTGLTLEEIQSYPNPKDQFKKFRRLLEKYVDRYNPRQKMLLVGYNNRQFDDQVLRAFFSRNGDKFFGSYFWSNSLDVLVLAGEYLTFRRPNMKNFKLATVADELGLTPQSENYHDALFDVKVTRAIYEIVTGRAMEL